MLGFMNRVMEIFINGTVTSIETTVANHFEMFLRDMPNETFDEIDSRDGFVNKLLILMSIIMKRDILSIIRINSGRGNDRAAKIATDILGNNFRVTEVGFCINIETVFMIRIAFSFNRLKGRTEV